MSWFNRLFRWVKMLFFKLTGKRMANLPIIKGTHPPLIDGQKITGVKIRARRDGTLYFSCLDGGTERTFNYSESLLLWFSKSEITVEDDTQLLAEDVDIPESIQELALAAQQNETAVRKRAMG